MMAENDQRARGGLRRTLVLGLFCLVFIVPLVLGYLHHRGRIFVFSGLVGPDAATVVLPPQPADWRTYQAGEPSRLAILLTDESSAWIGLAHGLKSLGVPFTITRDANEAVRHRVVLAYPYISGRVLKPEALRVLAAHPQGGGTLVAANVLGGGLKGVFGFDDVVPSRKRFALTFGETARSWLELDEPEEQTIRFGDPARGAEAQLGTHGYTRASEPIALFDDGSAAITRRRFAGGGAAYALGFDPGFLLLIGQNARGEDLERDYVNAYAPQNDTVLRLLRRIWREGEPLAVSLGRVPDAKPLAVMLTFDIDYTRSLPNAVAYAELLRERGVRGTFFVQTKYLRDYNDEIMLNAEAVVHLQRLKGLGMEIGSHTVAHSRAFRSFAMGTGRERYPDYQPTVLAREEAANGTILGELRVSKFLLEKLAPPLEVTSFRPGHLANPSALPQALQAAGYRYSSSVTAGNSLSHLPIHLTYDRGADAETGTFEFPLTVEDERAPLMGMRLPQSLDVARKIARDGGIFTVLIHPNILGHKLDFARGVLDRLKDAAWFGSVGDFGAWWAARDGVSLDVRRDGEHVVLSLATREAVRGLPVELPATWILDSPRPDIATKPGLVVMDAPAGVTEVRFRERLGQPVRSLARE